MVEAPHKPNDIEDDELVFAEGDLENEVVLDMGKPPWKVMLVDDDADVIQVTQMVLKGYRYHWYFPHVGTSNNKPNFTRPSANVSSSGTN